IIKRVDIYLSPVNADPNRLQQIMYNLVGNAIKYTDKGEVSVTANLIDEEYIAIVVSDTGRGISKEEQKVIFEPFQRGDKGEDVSAASTGIGLGVAKYLVNLHGGDLTVESEVGIGSIFMFQLPVDLALEHPVAEVTPKISVNHDNELTLTEPTTLTNKKTTKVLIVDDELVNLQVLMNHLTLENMEVMTTTNSQEVLDLVKE